MSSLPGLLLLLPLAVGDPALSVRLPGDAPVPGETLFAEARLGPGREAVSARAEWLGKSMTLHPERGGRIPVILAVPLGTSGPSRLRLEVRDDEDQTRAIELMVPIGPHDSPPGERWELPPAVAALASASRQLEERREIDALLSVAERRVRLFRDDFSRPLRGPVRGAFGIERALPGDPHGGEEAPVHRGLDLGARPRTSVKAPQHGVVLGTLTLPLLGESVLVDHGMGVVSLVGHLESWVVQAGDVVSPESVLGYVGETGLVHEPLVHYGIFVHGVPVDPRSFERLPTWLRAPPPAAAELDTSALAATVAATPVPLPAMPPMPAPPAPPGITATASDVAITATPATAMTPSTALATPAPSPGQPPAVPRPAVFGPVSTPPLPEDFDADELGVLLGRGIEARLPGARVGVSLESVEAKRGRAGPSTYTVRFEELAGTPFLTAVETTAFVAGELTSRTTAKTGRLVVVDARTGQQAVLATRDARQLWKERTGLATPIPRGH